MWVDDSAIIWQFYAFLQFHCSSMRFAATRHENTSLDDARVALAVLLCNAIPLKGFCAIIAGASLERPPADHNSIFLCREAQKTSTRICFMSQATIWASSLIFLWKYRRVKFISARTISRARHPRWPFNRIKTIEWEKGLLSKIYFSSPRQSQKREKVLCEIFIFCFGAMNFLFNLLMHREGFNCVTGKRALRVNRRNTNFLFKHVVALSQLHSKA